ncbi:MAG: glycosyltransferase family 2 protein [Akkermansiaceae bacterium]
MKLVKTRNKMKEELDFTIVTASYNYGKYIGECIESVIAQDGVTLEHLIFDGGSTDNTPEVVARYDSVLFKQEPDNGMCDAINKGFKAARGRWVMWLNSDDRLLPGALLEVKRFAEAQGEADVIYGGWNFINEDGSFKKRMTLFPHQKSMMLYVGCYIGSTSAFYRRETVIAEGHLLNEDFRYVMDGEFYARLAEKGKKFMYLPRILADFRWHGGNLSVRNYNVGNVDDWLTLQKQYAETRAIRRAYGKVWFKDENFNTFRDSFLYLFWRIMKPILKMIHFRKLKNNGE